ncbi:tail fiber domain-containing protein [Flavobacterium sp. MAH-1]|uniref:Tail fiber domain-containing protein n=1 Tax=Flavobacterium agri TaxID=2743471 RepID=A0A7Y9C6M8_9FLAO|nr:tail fiber domain-containing protein [Flavobacterium agri]NUY80372.1 tail fiber domain-containing protein [Flavobacterium agri]NYA70397.1 tail fiber domain-containing protein [Flavobacterium agri]
MKKVTLWAFLLLCFPIYAQIGINTITPNAMFEVNATDQGVLIPRVALTSALVSAPVVNPQGGALSVSTLIYNTATAGVSPNNVVPGFYFWNGTKWTALNSDLTGWSTTGNLGTSSTVNFIGTRDNQDVIFKRSNQRAGFLGQSNTSFGLRTLPTSGISTNNSAFGLEALFSNTTGEENSAIGNKALFSNISGDYNTAMGVEALTANSTGDYNTAIGRRALRSSVSGIANTALGYHALDSNTGDFNTAVGSIAFANGSGDGNTAIGRSALEQTSGSNNVAVGHKAAELLNSGSNNIAIGANTSLSSTTVSNELNIGNTVFGKIGATEKAIGININTPKAMLEVNSSNSGILIPRVALTSTTVAAPVTNPQTGALAESTMVYNTAMAGTSPDNVKPGFYYWNGTKWARFDSDGEKQPHFYTADATTLAPVATTMQAMPDMTVTFTPKQSVVFVNFSASGFSTTTACGNFSIFFQIHVNGVAVRSWQTPTEDVLNASTNRPSWDTTLSVPVSVTEGIPQTVSILWGTPGCNAGLNPVGTSVIAFSGFTYGALRTLTIIDPAGGSGVTGTPPVTASSWAVSGNSGLTAASNFIGTIDNADVVFKRNNMNSGRISLTNTAFGSESLITNSGGGNSAYGSEALADNVSGGSNTAIGARTMVSNDSGNFNVAVGREALLTNFTGNRNTAVGFSAMSAATQGQNNTALGNEAETSGVLTNATAIGSNALVSTSNSLVLGSISGTNSATADVNVGIGTTAPERALHISRGDSGGTPSVNTVLAMENDGPTFAQIMSPSTSESGYLFGTEVGSVRGGIVFNSPGLLEGIGFRSGGNTFRMGLTAAGDLGIGTATPGGQFELSLNEGRKPLSSAWTIPSDGRLKNIDGLYEKGLGEISRLKTVRYHYKNVPDKTFADEVLRESAVGFIAQEVREIFPEAVGVDRDGYLNFNMHPILVASVNALRQLDEKQKAITSEIEILKNENADLKAQIELMKSVMAEQSDMIRKVLAAQAENK